MSETGPGAAGARTGLRIGESLALAGALLASRAELAALELDEARRRALRCAALLLAAAVLALAALGGLSLLVAVLFWDTYRWQALAVLIAIYVATAAALVLWLRSELSSAPALFEATISELKRDGQALRSAWQ